jgi:signal transduction histidine kinase/ActR/RegA family two-component response regulator/ABC-type amino acid transport substrate-binding protein
MYTLRHNNRCITMMLLLISFTCAMGVFAPALAAHPVRIGVLAFRPKPQTLAQWQPLAGALKTAMPDRDFIIEALTYPELDSAVAARTLDFVLTNSAHYVLLARRSGLSAPLATVEVNENGRHLSVFGGVIFTRGGSSAINSLEDIKGRTVAVTSTESFGGYLMQSLEINQAGMHFPEDATVIQTGMPHDNVIQSVLSGRADVGFVRTGVLEGMMREAKLNRSQIKILNEQTIPGFGLTVSTRLYPEWPFAAMPGIDENLARRVAAALFLVEDNTTASRAMGIHGFIIPSDYTIVENLLRELRLPPFDTVPQFTLQDVLERYRWQLFGGLIIGGLILLLLLRLQLINRKLDIEKHIVLGQQETIKVSERQYRQLFDQMISGLMVCEVIYDSSGTPVDHRFINGNLAFEKLTGLVVREQVGRTGKECGIHWPPDILQRLYTVARTGEPIEYERYNESLGKYYETRVFSPRPGQFAHVFTDITDRKISEENLRRIEDRLRQSEKMEAVGQLAGGIAHDFNNVLGGIIGFTDLSLSMVDKNSTLEKNLTKVVKAADRAKHLVKQILAFSRQSTSQKSITSIRPIIAEVLELLKSSIPSSVIIESDLRADAKPVLADPTQIHQVLLNLGTNSVQAMDRKGTLTVKLYPVVVDHVEHGQSKDIVEGEYSVIEVADTGCGMDAATLSKAFEPFFTTKPIGEGTGMGLSVVLGIVQTHGGEIKITSSVGAGTVIRIYLPAIDVSITGTTSDEKYIQLAGTERILFIDDEQMLVDMAENILTPLGYTVYGMSNSVDALAFIQKKGADIDIIVTDQTMPGLTGMELAKEALTMRTDLPIIVCTGYSNDITVEQTARNGIARLIMKPYGSNEICRAIREVLDGAKKRS